MMRLKRQEGNVIILVTLMMFAIMGIIATVVDIGVVYAEQAKLSKALDAAILAGGQELPGRPDLARSIMELYLVENGVNVEDVVIEIDLDNMGAQITGNRDVDLFFAKIIGFTTANVDSASRIELGYASSAKGGLRPFAVTKFDYQFGDTVILKEGAGDSYHGNFGAVALGGTGTSVLLDNALYGYDGVVKIGDYISTEPGNMASIIPPLKCYISSFTDTFETMERGTDRIWTIPLVDSLEVDGRDVVLVVGFGQFFIERVDKKAGKGELVGRFIQYVTNGEIDQTIDNTGTFGMKLVN
ncbi:MAG: Tad domain-containing protein [Clostridia bacterium]|nr:Tad domain-containing protein [Clostridia bacterium]